MRRKGSLEGGLPDEEPMVVMTATAVVTVARVEERAMVSLEG